MSEDLPDGWTELQLASVASLVTGSTPSTKSAHFYDGGTVPFVKPGDLGTSRPITTAESLVTLAGAAEGRLLPPGSSLVCCIGSIGKQGFLGCEAIANQQINAAIPGPAVLPRYLFHALSTLTRWLDEHSSETTIRIINKGRFSEAPIRLAPLPEQHRIVEKVEALLEQVNRAKERLERVPLILKRFRQAVLAAACSGELTREWRFGRTFGAHSMLPVENDLPPLPELPDGWSLIPLEQVVQRFQYGTSDKADANEGAGIPVLRMGNIQDGKLDLSDLKYIGRQAADGFLVEPGDVLFNRTNSPELVGKTAVVESDRPMAFASYLIRVKVKGSRVRPDFVCWWINSAWGRQWARQVRTDGVSQSNINASKLAAMPVPLPSIEEQDETLRIGSSLLKLADTIERRVQAATARANKLPQSILSKAFSGELVPTEAELARLEGRTYETAEELLKRVTALGSDAPSARKGRGRRTG